MWPLFPKLLHGYGVKNGVYTFQFKRSVVNCKEEDIITVEEKPYVWLSLLFSILGSDHVFYSLKEIRSFRPYWMSLLILTCINYGVTFNFLKYYQYQKSIIVLNDGLVWAVLILPIFATFLLNRIVRLLILRNYCFFKYKLKLKGKDIYFFDEFDSRVKAILDSFFYERKNRDDVSRFNVFDFYKYVLIFLAVVSVPFLIYGFKNIFSDTDTLHYFIREGFSKSSWFDYYKHTSLFKILFDGITVGFLNSIIVVSLANIIHYIIHLYHNIQRFPDLLDKIGNVIVVIIGMPVSIVMVYLLGGILILPSPETLWLILTLLCLTFLIKRLPTKKELVIGLISVIIFTIVRHLIYWTNGGTIPDPNDNVTNPSYFHFFGVPFNDHNGIIYFLYIFLIIFLPLILMMIIIPIIGIKYYVAKESQIDCPRCLGKGHVDEEDIKRLNRENDWIPGPCAYCEGEGNVPSGLPTKIDPDYVDLVMDLSEEERKKLKE